MFWKKQNEDFIEMEKRIENGYLAKYSADGNNTIRVRNSERADLVQIGKRNKSKSQKNGIMSSVFEFATEAIFSIIGRIIDYFL